MSKPYLTCHTLRRLVQRRDRQEIILPCSMSAAVDILALYLENKDIALSQIKYIPSRVFDTDLWVCRVTPKQVAVGLLKAASSGLWDRFQFWWMKRLVVASRLSRETAVSETIFEIIHLPGYGFRMAENLADVNVDELIMLRMHLWSQLENVTYLRLFLGWNDAADARVINQIMDLLDDYVIRILRLTSAAPGITEKNETLKPPKVADPDPDPVNNLPTVTIDANDESELLTYPEIGSKGELPSSQLWDTTTMDLSVATRPRIYARSLLKICRMAVVRQKALDENRPIPSIEQVRQKYGPSYNTLLKVIDLVNNWDEKTYFWDVTFWLKAHSGHTSTEITDRLNDIRTSLDPEDWFRVTTEV